jgi:REP element-mobilizing transposase RayT
MVTYGVKSGDPLILDASDRLLIAQNISAACRSHAVPVVAWNVLPDHVHMILAAEDERELDEQVRKIKGFSSFSFQRARGWDEGGHVWAQKYHHLLITDQRMLESAYTYVMDNHLKHAEQWGQELIDMFEAHLPALPFTSPSTLPGDTTRGLSSLPSSPPTRGLSPLPSSPPTRGLSPLPGDPTRGLSPLLIDVLKDVRDELCVTPEIACHPSPGGFDIIIGNPPYGADIKEHEDIYLENHFISFSGTKDVFTCFMENGIHLLRNSGLISYIIPSAWVGGPLYLKLRKILLSYQINRLILLPFDIFANAYVDTLIIGVTKFPSETGHLVSTYVFPKREKLTKIKLADDQYNNVRQEEWNETVDNKFVFNPKIIGLIKHLRKTCPTSIGDIATMKRGVLFDKSLLSGSRLSDQHYLYFEGDVYRYVINIVTNRWVEFSDRMKERPKEFYWFEGDRILFRRLVNRRQRLMASMTDKTFITNKNLYSIKVNNCDIRFLLGVLNSTLLSFLYINQVTQAVKDDFPQVTIKDILSLPFPRNINNSDIKSQNRMVYLVEHMLSLHQQLAAALSPTEKTLLERQIDTTDAQIDALVYELYKLTEEEIRLVEGK